MNILLIFSLILGVVALLGLLHLSGFVFDALYKTPLSVYEISSIKHFKDKSDQYNPQCVTNLMKYVYLPERLFVIDDCVTILGVITKIEPMDDGDEHVLIKPDPGFARSVNIFNKLLMDGNLITEPVCQVETKGKESLGSCAGYSHKIDIPPTGAHVKITGTFVIDKSYGWTEIHPVSGFEIVK